MWQNFNAASEPDFWTKPILLIIWHPFALNTARYIF